MEKRTNNPLAGLAGLLSLASDGASEQSNRRGSSAPSATELADMARSMGMPESLMRALGLIQSPADLARKAVADELEKYNGDYEAAMNDSIRDSRAAGKLQGVLALAKTASKFAIDEAAESADLSNTKAAPEAKEIIERVLREYIVASTSIDDVLNSDGRGPRATSPVKRAGFELAAKVLWSNAIKGIRTLAQLADREGFDFEPALAKITLSNPVWSLIDDALEIDGEDETTA